jgi:hypothetical protein
MSSQCRLRDEAVRSNLHRHLSLNRWRLLHLFSGFGLTSPSPPPPSPTHFTVEAILGCSCAVGITDKAQPLHRRVCARRVPPPHRHMHGPHHTLQCREGTGQGYHRHGPCLIHTLHHCGCRGRRPAGVCLDVATWCGVDSGDRTRTRRSHNG